MAAIIRPLEKTFELVANGFQRNHSENTIRSKDFAFYVLYKFSNKFSKDFSKKVQKVTHFCEFSRTFSIGPVVRIKLDKTEPVDESRVIVGKSLRNALSIILGSICILFEILKNILKPFKKLVLSHYSAP